MGCMSVRVRQGATAPKATELTPGKDLGMPQTGVTATYWPHKPMLRVRVPGLQPDVGSLPNDVRAAVCLTQNDNAR